MTITPIQNGTFSKVLFLQDNTSQEQDYIIGAVTPKIIAHQDIFKAQRTAMSANYRSFVETYNRSRKKRNSEVLKYNANVEAFLIQHKLHAESEAATNELKASFGEKSQRKISIEKYNEAARIYNQNAGKLLVKLKKFMPLRKALEHTFMAILFKYSLQISAKNAFNQKIGITTSRGLQKCKINHSDLATTRINDISLLGYDKRTIHNHVNRMIEAGIFFDYEMKGNTRPIEVYINPEILEVFDHKTGKTLNAKDQLFTLTFMKTLHDKKIVTEFLNNYQIKGLVNKSDKGEKTVFFQSLQLSEDNSPKNSNKQLTDAGNDPDKYKGTEQATAKFETGQKNQAKSEFLRRQIQPKIKFIQDLAAGDYDNYTFVSRSKLEHEISNGYLQKAELRELMLQTAVKMAAPIWRDKQVVPGSWGKALQIIEETFLINPNGSIPNKEALMYQFDNLVYRITYAKRYFKRRPDFKPLFPGQYFDPTRKTSKSGGFAYTVEALKRHLDHPNNIAKRKAKRNAEAAERNKRLSEIELVQSKVMELKKGRIDVEALYNYLYDDKKVSQAILSKIPEYIRKAYQC